MNKHFKSLEFDKILELLSKECTFPDAREQAMNIKPVFSKEEAQALMKETDDAYCLIGKFGTPSFGSLKDTSSSLKRAQAGAGLSPLELLRIGEVLRVIRSLKQWRNASDDRQSTLDKYFNRLMPNKFLEDKISDAIIAEDEISDKASPTLSDIRRKIRTASSKAREVLDKIVHGSSYSKYLQDKVITQRDGRFVVPVKAECRGNIPGLVHDTSGSGQTVFIEPMGVVQANNDIRMLRNKEQEEIERILLELSGMAGDCADSIIGSYQNLIDLNIIFAKGNLAYKMKATTPIINDEGYINLKKARHPLIDRDKVVPVDITLGREYTTLVITGPNTGGKTVSLKTTGLLTLMAMSGIMLPCGDESEISVFKKILVDIGDEQSIEQSLSTFSAHMTNIIGIIDQASRYSLVLIDELGAGTDPVEGAALAVAILQKLKAKGAKIQCTTHYAELKEFAITTEGVENGCCEFDVKTLRPTYKLLIGVPGKSNAFAISKRLGLSEEIIDNAKQLVSSESRRFEDTIQQLEERRQVLERRLKEANDTKAYAGRQREKANSIIEKAKKEAEKEIEKAREEAERISRKTKAQAQSILDRLENMEKQQRMDAEKKAKLRKSIQKMETLADPITKKKAEKYTPPRPFKVGDSVLIYDIDKNAEILSIDEREQTAILQAGIIKTKVKLSNLRLNKEKPKTTVQSSRRSVPSKMDMKPATEVDVRGQTAMDAIMEVDSAIDQAVLMNMGQLTIIHGKGTGVLRTEIQKFLRTHKNIKSFRLGTYGEGDAGVTICEIK
ncbi:MAG: endonuclease MutS2 [Oscillospiraceae bacterium]|nr:endonuclease MutS2 [Oscillospiraceae bacterium]